MSDLTRGGFWQEAVALHGSITPYVLPRVFAFGVIAAAVCGAARLIEWQFQVRFALNVTPHELAGTVLGILLVLRTNAGYDRWWEARKLWGGFVDRSRNFVIGAMVYGPDDKDWREKIVRWAAAYPHVARHSLRNEKPGIEVSNLVGPQNAQKLASAEHMPSCVALNLAELLREACDRMGMDRFSSIHVDRERILLIDSYGGCERILNTPLPRAYSIKIRHIIVCFLVTLPLALLHRFESDWMVPLIVMAVGYPLLSLDQLGVELENPFSVRNLSHLPIDVISATIERNVLGLLELKRTNDSPARLPEKEYASSRHSVPDGPTVRD